ncbi:MAG: hypothetical protein OEW18_03595 [Candidatus Aminicenantes bacterium]|nr:hypothetical protein [Candidatus Aminicenantes bacterium]
MKKRILITTAAALAALAVSNLDAMPAFARKYQMSCKTCHAPFPKLKPYGNEFAGNGFVIKDKDTPRYYIDTGDDFLSLLREVPIAFRLEGFWTYNLSHSKKLDFTAPRVLKVISGGELAKHISYYFYFFFSELGEVAGIEDAFLMFNDVLATDLDLYIGQFQVSDPLFKREIRLPFEDYLIYAARPGSSRIDLTYDRGLMATYGVAGLDLALEVVNGSGLEPANPFENFDTDKYKNVLFRLSRDFSPAARLGAFGYSGKERQSEIDNSVWMLGGDATFGAAPFELNLQYVERSDSDPFFSQGLLGKVRTRGAFAELIYLPRGDDSRWYGLGLFNWVDSDVEELRTTTLTVGAGILLRRNLRAVAEFTHVLKGPYGEYPRLAVGLVTAF